MKIKSTIGQITNGGEDFSPLGAITIENVLNTPNQQTWNTNFQGEPFVDVEYQISDQPDFTNSIIEEAIGTNIVDLLASGQAFLNYYFQARGRTADGRRGLWSESEFVQVPLPEPVSDTFPQITPGNGELTIDYRTVPEVSQQSNLDTALKDVTLFYRLKGDSVWIENGTFPPTGQLLLGSLVNETTYEVQLRHNPTNLNYLESFSSILEGTPTAALPKLPDIQTALFSQSSQVLGTHTWSPLGQADDYEVFINGISITTTASTNANLDISGFSIGEQITIGVEGRASGFENSNRFLYQYVIQDFAADIITPEQFAGMAYEKPLYGSQYEGFDFPLINYVPLDEASFNALGTGLNYADYPNGVTRLNPVSNDGLGTPIMGVFDSQDVGKRFCGYDNNLNGTPITYVDEYKDNSVGARYCNVIYQTADYCLVDFEYNGGDSVTSQPQNNGKGYIFFDASNALNQVAAEWNNLSTPERIVLHPLTRNGYVLTSYVCPTFMGFTLDINKKLLLGTGTISPSRIKPWIEDYNVTRVPTGGAQLYSQPVALCTFTVAFENQCIFQDVQVIPPHRQFTIAEPYRWNFCTGGMGAGTFLARNVKNQSVANEMSAGGNYDPDLDRFIIQAGNSTGGTFTGDGTNETDDVDKFGFISFVGEVDFAGIECMGVTGGGARGSTYYVMDDFTGNIQPSGKYGIYTQTFQARFTTDYSGIWDSGGVDDPTTKTHLPSHCVETTSFEGNNWLNRRMGGNNRSFWLHIDKFIFVWNTPRTNNVIDYYSPTYRGNESALPEEAWHGMTRGAKTISAKKAILSWEIPQVGQVVTVSRDYWIGQPRANQSVPVGFPFRNAIRTHPDWVGEFNQRADDLDQANRDYIVAVDRRPKEFQVGDEFKILSWIDLVDVTGLNAGDPVTGDQTGATGTIHFIDNHIHTNRVMIFSATGSFDGDTTINSSAYTITAASTYDPNQVYRCKRKQRGDFYTSTKQTVESYDGTYEHFYGQYAEFYPCRTLGNIQQSYQYSYLMVEPNLPNNIMGDDLTYRHFDIEVVTSESEYLLDGQSRPARTTYHGVGFYGIYGYAAADTFYRLRAGRTGSFQCGYGEAYLGAPDDNLTGFDSQPWVISGEASNNITYSRAEMSWYLKSPSNWQAANVYRALLSNQGNNSQFRPAGKTAFSPFSLARWSKGYTLINVKGVRRIGEVEKNSSGEQFVNTAQVYTDNPAYDPAYATAEEMLPPNESAPYLPKFRVYGADAVAYYQGEVIEYPNPQFDTDDANAPDLPKTIRDILLTLPS